MLTYYFMIVNSTTSIIFINTEEIIYYLCWKQNVKPLYYYSVMVFVHVLTIWFSLSEASHHILISMETDFFHGRADNKFM